MGLFSRKKAAAPAEVPNKRTYAPNPYLKARSAGFFSIDTDRLLNGWDTTSQTIDFYLQSELRQMRARSRKMVRANPYGKRFISTIKANVVGPNGVNIQARSLRLNGDLDTPANDAIEKAFHEWATRHCDYNGRLTFIDMQNLAISNAGQDGEFIFRKFSTGPYGFQLQIVDPELLNVEKNETVKGGGEIRLGVEYDKNGKIIRYHFKKKSHPAMGGYDNYQKYSVPAKDIIHGFISEWPDQSRGVPWMHASLERSKHLEKYEEAAIVKARSTAATMAVLRSPAGDDAYEGDEQYSEGVTLDQYEAGTIKDIGDREITNLDSDYPHQMYGSFVKAHLQGIASGLGISYHSLSSDLEGVNYSSIRAGVLEDREIFKGIQNWFIRAFVQPVFEEWITIAVMQGLIKIGRIPLGKPVEEYWHAHYQGRRWAWVDPQKDGAANQLAIDNLTKSRSQVIREQGDDPESIFREIRAEKDMLDRLGLAPVQQSTEAPAHDGPEE
jgi:lambda family phage portal protein